jgi:4-amino-4-deoxy-L-arabinose transferase-like glycosyltransferase
MSRRIPALLFLLALAVRVPMLLTQHDDYASGGITTAMGLVARNVLAGRGLVETMGPDEILRLYDRQQAEGRLIDIEEFPDPADPPTKPLIQRMPGYPLFLASVWRLTGRQTYLPAQWVQVVLGAMLPLLLYGAGRRLFGGTAGVIAGTITALNPPLAWLSVVPLYDGFVLLVAGLVIWLLARAHGRGQPLVDWTWIGVAAAAGVYFKSTFLILPPLVAAATIPRLGLRRAALRGALAAGLPLLALLPWAVRNERIYHRPILTNTFFWATVWEGFGEIGNDFGAVLDDRATYAAMTAGHPEIAYASPEYDDLIRPHVLEVLRTRPGFLVRLAVHRLLRGLLMPDDRWGIPSAERPGHSLAEFRARTGGGPLAYAAAEPLAAAVKALQRLWGPLLLGMACLSLWMHQRRWRDLLPTLGVAAAFISTAVLLHLEGRYLLPAALVWTLFASGITAAAPER